MKFYFMKCFYKSGLCFTFMPLVRALYTFKTFTYTAAAKSLQSCPTLCDPIDSNPLGSPVPGILHARTLEWVAILSPMHESEKRK